MDWVRSVAFSPDGTSIVSCSDDKVIRTWDVSDSFAKELQEGSFFSPYHPLSALSHILLLFSYMMSLAGKKKKAGGRVVPTCAGPGLVSDWGTGLRLHLLLAALLVSCARIDTLLFVISLPICPFLALRKNLCTTMITMMDVSWCNEFRSHAGVRPATDGPSLYNNDKGIHYRFDVLGWPDSRRKNAKRPVVTEYIFCHEDMPLKDVLVSGLYKHNRIELLNDYTLSSESTPDTRLPDLSFTLEGGIPRKRAACSINTVSDFIDIRKASLYKDEAEVHLKLTLLERADDDEAAEEHEEAPAAKKNKVRYVALSTPDHCICATRFTRPLNSGPQRGGAGSR
jgi:hypothetical protein